MENTKEVLAFAVDLGDQLLRNGGEVYRVEDTVLNILKAYEVEDYDVYVLSNGIFASANEKRDDACSVVRHVPLASYDLKRVIEMNQLSRDVCEKKITLAQAWVRLEECKNLSSYRLLTRVMFCGIGTGCFAVMFGGGIEEAIVAFFIGMMEQVLLAVLRKSSASKFIGNIICSIMVAVLTLITLFFGMANNYHATIIGSIMPLVPGIALTTSIRDFNNGDYLSGAIHFIDALMTAFCIAAGVGVVMILASKYLGGVLPL